MAFGTVHHPTHNDGDANDSARDLKILFNKGMQNTWKRLSFVHRQVNIRKKESLFTL